MKKLTQALPAAALIAAVMAVSASTGAVAAAMITGADIKNNTVTSADLKNKSVTGKDVKDGALTAADLSSATVSALKGTDGANGAAGTNGTNGTNGAAGAPGVSGLVQVEATAVVAPSDAKVLKVTCPAGKKILGIAADWSTTNLIDSTAYIFPDLTAGEGYAFNDGGINQTFRVSATCATVG